MKMQLDIRYNKQLYSENVQENQRVYSIVYCKLRYKLLILVKFEVVFSVKDKFGELTLEHGNDIIFEYLFIPAALLLLKVLDDRLQNFFLAFN